MAKRVISISERRERRESPENGVKAAPKSAIRSNSEHGYMPLEDDPTVAQEFAAGAATESAISGSAAPTGKASMHDVFGPGGLLERCMIGGYEHPTVRLPGAGGAPEIAAHCRQTYVMLRQSPRAFVERLDFRSTLGQGDGPGARDRFNYKGAGVTAVVTDRSLWAMSWALAEPASPLISAIPAT